MHCKHTFFLSFFRGEYFVYKGGDLDYEGMEVHERIWLLNEFNFNHVGAAMLALFTVATFEGWPK